MNWLASRFHVSRVHVSPHPPSTLHSRHMPSKRKPRHKDMTDRYLSDDADDAAHDVHQTFSARSGQKAQQSKMEKTALLRAAEEAASPDVDVLPVGQVTQVYSLYCDV